MKTKIRPQETPWANNLFLFDDDKLVEDRINKQYDISKNISPSIYGVNNWLQSKDTTTIQTHHATTISVNFLYKNFHYLSFHFYLHVYMYKSLSKPDYMYFICSYSPIGIIKE